MSTAVTAPPAHGFAPVAGFLIDGAAGTPRAPFREEFMTVEAAAHECSLEPRCRGFTFSSLHMQDDKLHFVRFFSHNRVAVSGDWVSHLKEPTHAHRYDFSPGYLLPKVDNDPAGDAYDDDAQKVELPPLEPIHAEQTTLFDAQRYCDAEPACEGFTMPRNGRSASGSQVANRDGGSNGGGGDGGGDGGTACDDGTGAGHCRGDEGGDGGEEGDEGGDGGGDTAC